MKNTIIKICYIANFILVIVAIMLPLTYFFEINYLSDFLVSDVGFITRSILAILASVIWFYCIYIWAKFDKNIPRLFLILFLSSLYIVFYYRKALKEGWN